MLQSAGIAAGVALSVPLAQILAQAPATVPPPAPGPPPIPLDATKVPGLPSGPLSDRSPFEKPALAPLNVSSGATNTPHQQLRGTITPSDLHFQRHHNGIALIDPAKYSLTIHGLVERPLTFSLDELKRFPAETRTYFVECAGNGRAAYRTPKPEMTPQDVDGMTSNAEWTGVLVSTLLSEVGVNSAAKWVLAEGGDAALLSRSIPMEKMLGDALVAYAQNGEPVRAGEWLSRSARAAGLRRQHVHQVAASPQGHHRAEHVARRNGEVHRPAARRHVAPVQLRDGCEVHHHRRRRIRRSCVAQAGGPSPASRGRDAARSRAWT